MDHHDVDLFVLGAGSGGVRAARVAAQLGARVAIAEERSLGGTCVNVGCIPKKLFVYASHFADDFEDARAFGWQSERPSFDWRRLVENKNREIARLNGVYARLLDEAGVERIEGRATIVDPHTVAVSGRKLRARYILVATGGRPLLPAMPGADLGITSDHAFHLQELPPTVIVCGGGYIASEFAGIFHGLGCRVTQLYRGALFLRGFDHDLRAGLAAQMRHRGIDLRFETNIARLERQDGRVAATLSDGSRLTTDAVLFAIGRLPNSQGLGLESAGVEINARGAVLVDDYARTSCESIYAVGDVTDRLQLTPVALAEGSAVAHTLFGDRPTRADHESVPTCVFSQPSIGTVGLTEEAARARYDRVDVYRSAFRPLKHTITGREEVSVMKLVVDGDTDRVLGIHVLGPEAGEIVQGFAVALKMGATKAQLDATIGIHPTAAEELVTMRTRSAPV